LNRILDDKAVAKRFDQKHWQAVFPELRSLFRNLRDVARFLGGFAFHVSLFRRANSFEVNPVDLIAVEALRLFEPGVYAKTRGAKGVLTSAGSAFGSRRDTKPDQAVVQAIIDAASAPRKEAIRGLIKELFPVVSGLFGGPAYGQGYSESWFRGSRVCHEQVFDRYFLLALPANDVSQADLDYLLDNSGDQAAVSDRLMQHAGAGQIEAVLDRLEAYKEQLPRSSIVPFITAIMNVGDLLPARAAGLFVIGADMHATRFVHWALKSFADPKDRAAAFREACLQSSGIVIPLRTVVDQEAKEKSEDHPERYFLSDEDIGVCKQALLARIRSRALLDLERIPFLPWVLYRWKTWGTPSEVEDWVAGLMKRASGVTTLLVQFMNKSTSTPVGGGAVTTHYSIRLSSLREFTGVELVEAALSQLDDRSVGEEQRAAIDAFHKALRREKAGKPEDDWPRDEDDED
jgi:predicted KAP-like P-loop ATPase